MRTLMRASLSVAACALAGLYAAPSALAQDTNSYAARRERFVNMLLTSSSRENANTVAETRSTAGSGGVAQTNTTAINPIHANGGVSSVRRPVGTVSESRTANMLNSRGTRDIRIEERISSTARGSTQWGLQQRFQHLTNSINAAIRLEPINPDAANALGYEATSRFGVLYNDIRGQLALVQGKEASIEQQIIALQSITPVNPAQAHHIQATINMLQRQLGLLSGRATALNQLLTASTPIYPGA